MNLAKYSSIGRALKDLLFKYVLLLSNKISLSLEIGHRHRVTSIHLSGDDHAAEKWRAKFAWNKFGRIHPSALQRETDTGS
jgi:hypothetical protein